MFIDLTLELSPEQYRKLDVPSLKGGDSQEGHIGTHFDVMDKIFPLESFRTRGRLIDISRIRDREVEIPDIEPYGLREGDMAIFYTGYVAELGYGTPLYWKRSAELSDAVVAYMADLGVRLIGVDAAGVQKPKKHRDIDQYCADRNIFIVENMDNLRALPCSPDESFTVFTAPLKRLGITGLPCRVVAEITG
jgi:kynurenine formamidase